MKNFVAIDFETANRNLTSICSVGIVIVNDEKIVESFYKLIKPQPNYYDYWNTKVHGLSNKDTDDASYFPEVWAVIAPKIDGYTLVAHNSSFDEGCIKAAHSFYRIPYPNYQFMCTYRAARKFYGKSLKNHQLHTVSDACGFHLENHHHALADALACAAIAIRIL